MQDETSQRSFLTVVGVLCTVIALTALIALIRYSSRADSSTESATINSVNPTVDSISLSGSSRGALIAGEFTPNEGTTKKLYVYGTISDRNGYTDFRAIWITVGRSGAFCDPEGYTYPGVPVLVPSTTVSPNDCYTKASLAVDLTNCSGNSCDFETSFDIANYVDPTDVGSPYEAQNWEVYVAVLDNEGNGTLPGPATFEVNSLAALDVSPLAINYGTVALGGDSVEQTETFTNTGNRNVNTLASADADMTSNLPGYSDIPSGNVHVTTTAAQSYAAGVSLVNAPSTQLVSIRLPQQVLVDAGTPPTRNAYFQLHVPASGVNGSYSNTLTFTAAAY